MDSEVGFGCEHIMRVLCRTFHVWGHTCNGVSSESWCSGLMADENKWHTTIDWVLGPARNSLTLTKKVGDAVLASHVTSLHNPGVCTMLSTPTMYYLLQNLMFYTLDADDAVAALIIAFEAKQGTVTLDNTITLESLVSMLMTVMWISADGHKCLPFSAVHEDPTMEYFLLFSFCLHSAANFYLTEAVVNPFKLNLVQGKSPFDSRLMRSRYVGGGNWHEVPVTNNPGLPGLGFGPGYMQSKRKFTFAFFDFCTAHAPRLVDTVWPEVSHVVPRLSLPDCDMAPLPFTIRYFDCGTTFIQRCRIWAFVMSVNRDEVVYCLGELPAELVLLILYKTTDMDMFDPPRAYADDGDPLSSHYDYTSCEETDSEAETDVDGQNNA